MSIDFNTQINELLDAASTNGAAYGKDLTEGLYKNAYSTLVWVEYLRNSELTGVADESLNGVQAAIIETLGCLSLGLVRPAIFSLRAQIDLLLAWLYFKDHQIEWHCVQDRGKGFKLKSEVITYLCDLIPNYKTRFSLLMQSKTRKEEDPYRLLSAHIHSQSSPTIPSINNLKSLVKDKSTCDQCVKLQYEVNEYISDVLSSYYADKWASLPGELVTNVKNRLNSKQQATFYS